MQIKRFEAKDVQEALRQVKEAMGPDALILSTKKVKRSSFPFEFPRRSWVEVVAAIDRRAEPKPQCVPSSFLPPKGEQPTGTRVEEEGILQRILSTGLCPELVYSLAQEISPPGEEGRSRTLSEAYRNSLRRKLMEGIEVTGPSSDGPKIWSFIGPTGVGKTTTLVKLAAHFRIRHAKKTTLITLDTYRIGAVEQLKSYGLLLDVPVEIAIDPEQLKQVIERNRHQDILLIDTPGRSPSQRGDLQELKSLLTVHPQIENHLLLSATTKEQDLRRAVERFSLLPIASYIFSKIDETEEYAPMLNQLMRDRRPLSYLTCGQRVPEDIVLATKGKVAELVLNQIQWN
ncbi:MAG: hypothetical protein ACUVWO_07760 [Thermodesulfobacteriota bacterium]